MTIFEENDIIAAPETFEVKKVKDHGQFIMIKTNEQNKLKEIRLNVTDNNKIYIKYDRVSSPEQRLGLLERCRQDSSLSFFDVGSAYNGYGIRLHGIIQALRQTLPSYQIIIDTWNLDRLARDYGK